jgi:hypothetical protein
MSLSAFGRALALLAALVAAVGIPLQFAALVLLFGAQGVGPAVSAWRFVGMFTTLANVAVVIIATMSVVRPKSSLATPRLRLATVTAIAMTGLVYSALLRDAWSQPGLQGFADHIVHDATPALYVVAWALAPHGTLVWRDVVAALAPPLAYCAYALARGAIDGWYAYWFLDPTALGWMQMGVKIGVLCAAFAIVALAFISADKALAARPTR